MSESKVLFLHVPKVAGSSMNHSPLSKRIDFKIHSFKGDVVDKIKALGAEGSFKFGFVRNPYSRFVSLYNYFYKMPENHMYYQYNGAICKVIKSYKTFNEFTIAFPDLRIRNNFHFQPQANYFVSKNVDFKVDFIGRYEELQCDVDKLSSILNVENFELGLSNSSGKVNSYLELYTQESLKVVSDFYAEDFCEFNYNQLEEI